MKYAPGLPPTDDARLREYIQKELLKISDTIDQIHLHEKSFKSPPKPQDGQVEFADGINWNPDASSGEGLYRYDASSDTWKYLEGSGTSNSPLTTKGDVWGYSTTDARIPVGTDDQVLTADSTQALGVKWADAAGGISSPLTTNGDIWIYDSGDTRLPRGSNTEALISTASGLDWFPRGAVINAGFNSGIYSGSFGTSYVTIGSASITKKESTTYIYALASATFTGGSGNSDFVRMDLIHSGEGDSYLAEVSVTDGSGNQLYGTGSGLRRKYINSTGAQTFSIRAKSSGTGAQCARWQIILFESTL